MGRRNLFRSPPGAMGTAFLPQRRGAETVTRPTSQGRCRRASVFISAASKAKAEAWPSLQAYCRSRWGAQDLRHSRTG
jgi:hypothetical protein